MNSIHAALSCAVLFFAPAAPAQSLNIDCGPLPTPSAQYGAASGQAGYWNALHMPSTGVPLVGLLGQPTNAIGSTTNTCDEYTCAFCSSGTCPGFAGSPDDEAFLGSWINADCAHDYHLVYVSGLEPGRYAVHIYTYGCAVPPAATVELFANNTFVYVFSTPGVVWNGNWAGFPVGRKAFEVFPGGTVSFRLWGQTETGLAGIQLEKLDPSGQVSCLGDGTGAACPCGNYGLPGHGCRNSRTIRGAELGAVGRASLSFDSLGLNCGYEPPGAASIVLQGNQVIAPVVFGDGLRCAGGSLKRMYFTSASATGTFSVPPNLGASVSERSAVLGDTLQPGALRVYQVYYRDPDPNFCPPPQGSTFNVSNAVEIVWGS